MLSRVVSVLPAGWAEASPRWTAPTEPSGRKSRMSSSASGHWTLTTLSTPVVPKACPNEMARTVFAWLVVARTGRSRGIPIA